MITVGTCYFLLTLLTPYDQNIGFCFPLTYFFPSLSVRMLACSLPGRQVPMFTRRMPLLEVHNGPLQASSEATLENDAVLGECRPICLGSSFNLFHTIRI